jgi:hypothetical protein
MDPFTLMLIATAITAATTGYSLQQQNVLSKRASNIQQQSADVEAAQLKMAQESEKTQSAQAELDRQRELKQVLATQNAIFGSSGASLSSGTFIGIQTADVSRASEATRLNQLFTDTRQIGLQINQANAQFNVAAQLSGNRSMRQANAINAGSNILQSGLKGYAGYKAKKAGNNDLANSIFGGL